MSVKIEVIGDAEVAAPYIEWAKQQWSRQDQPRVFKHTGDCLIESVKTESHEVIRFYTETSSGFIMHPRTGAVETLRLNNGEVLIPSVRGGWSITGGGITALDTLYPFPIIDNDNASLLVDQEKEEVQFLEESSSYGNYFLINGEEILSWKGAPNRHSQLAFALQLPGLESSNRSFSGFTDKLYSGGVLYGSGPVVGGVDGYIYGLAYYVNRYVAVIKYNRLLCLYSTSNPADNTKWELLFQTADTTKDLPWWFTSTDDSISAISSEGDILTQNGFTAKPTHIINTSMSAPNEYFVSGSAKVCYEGLNNSLVFTIYESNISQDGSVDISTATTLETRSEFAPDGVHITRAGTLFCASLINSEGLGFNCSPCPTIVTWSGPVIPQEGTNCAVLESECYPPGENEVEIGATVKCGNFTASGSITITITGQAGYWGNNVCLYQYQTYTNEKNPDGTTACSNLVITDLGQCAPFELSGSTPSAAYFEIVGNKKNWYVNGSGQTRSSDCPCECSPVRGYLGLMGGDKEVTGEDTVKSNWGFYTQPDGSVIIYCQTNMKEKCYTDYIFYSVTKAPFGTQSWVCL